MSKRNFILLVIILTAIVILFFGFLYWEAGRTDTDPGEGTNFISRFNPFGTGGNRGQNGGDSTAPVDVSGYVPPEETRELYLMKISSMPVAGYGVFMKERLKDVPLPPPTPEPVPVEGETAPVVPKTPVKPLPPETEMVPAVRYVDRANGNIYQTFADRIEERKFSSTSIPRVYEAVFGNRAEAVIMRYLKSDARTIQTFWGVSPKELLGGDTANEQFTRGSLLSDNIKDMALSPGNQSLFYLFNVGDSAVGTTLDLATGKKVQVFDSAFSEWLSFWPNPKIITLTTKPASVALGYMYRLDPVTKSFGQIMGGISGLTTLMSPDGKLVLWTDNTLSLRLLNTETKENTPLSLRTMPEKCVWSKASDYLFCSVPKSLGALPYPEAWYQGETSFEDNIWKIDVVSGNTTLVTNLSAANEGEEIDGIKLSIDDTQKYLFFVNKKDSFLWKLDLK